MSEPDLSRRIDAVLGRLDDGAGDSSDSLLHAARELVDLDDRDRGVSSRHFRARLKGELFAAPSVAIATPSTPHKPVPPRPDPVRRKESRMSAPRLLAIAASLLLLLGGMGVVFEGPLRSSQAPEPSAIPAASFASPAPIGQNPALPVWTVPGPADTGYDESAHLLAGGRIFRAFQVISGPQYIQAVDATTGKVLWEKQIATEAGILVASDDVLVIAELYATSQDQDPAHHLVGLDAEYGIQRWDVKLAGPPAAATRMGDRVLVLGWNNTLDAIGIGDGQPVYSVDISGKSQWPANMPTELANFSPDPGRIATIGTTVAVVLADGSVAAIDGDTGTALWWMYRPPTGPTDLLAAGNRFIVVVNGLRYLLPDSTPESTPTAGTGCLTETTTSLAGTPVGQITPPTYDEIMYAVEPTTGEITWSGTTVLSPFQPSQLMASNGALFLDTSDQTGPNQTAGVQCSLALATGTITPLIYPASIALGAFINDVNNGRIMETVAIFANGQFVAYPTTQPVDSDIPVFDLSPYLSGSFWWVEIYDGAYYVSMGDGTLMKLAASA